MAFYLSNDLTIWLNWWRRSTKTNRLCY